ncbi:MAG: response regulator, partial [Butyricicoccaceae bacterium]
MIKILLVDDDFLVRTFLSRLTDWESHGYTLVGAAQDGEEALRMVEEYHPDIIITDVSMPVMDGIELIRRLRKGGNAARIVALSCHDDFDYVKEAMKLGADEYVLKNLLTEERLLALLSELKPSAGAQSGAMQFEGPEQERDYYLRLLRGDPDAKNGADSFHISAAMAIAIVHYDGYVGSMTLEQQKKFHSSFAQVCREAGQNQPNIRCIHVR